MEKEEIRKIVMEAIEDVLFSMTNNQLVCLNEMSVINCNEPNNGLFNRGSYQVYVKGEGGFKKYPHFHIRNIANGWDIRMNMDGTFHSIKSRGKGMQSERDAMKIERMAKQWVNQPNSITNGSMTNGELAMAIWKTNNQ